MQIPVGSALYPTYDLGVTGQNPGLTITNKVGSVVRARAASSVESPPGGGSYDFAPGVVIATAGQYKAAWDTASGGIVATDDITVGPTTDTVATQVAAIGALGAANVALTAPVANSGGAVIYQGNAYLYADGRALSWTSTSWPALTGAALSLKVAYGATTVIYAATYDAARSAHADLTVANTTALTPGLPYQYTLTATLADTSPVTLVRSGLSVLPA